MSKYSAFVIDDDREMRSSLTHLLDKAGWDVISFADANSALKRLPGLSPDVVLSDVRMPNVSGLDLLEKLKSQDAPPLLLISAHGDIPMAVSAIQNGAYSFLEKPFEPRRLLTAMQHAAEAHRLAAKAHRLRDDLMKLTGLDRILLGQHPKITSLKDQILDLSHAQGSVLIRGATGTGKELVARALHRLGPRHEGDFISVNCATLEPTRFEEQIFGRGDSNLGYFRRADGGTLFLDEIGACPPPVQPQLLRAIETGEVLPVGADKEVTTDVRVIAATHEDLESLVESGRFRSDLLFRLNAFQLHLPALRDRDDDIVLLFDHFLHAMAETYEVSPPDLTGEDTVALMSHAWPGNIRELRHVAERRILSARRGGGSVAEALNMDDDGSHVPGTLREATARFEAALIAQAIRTHQGKMDAVAEALGIGRRTLNEKIVKLGLEKEALLG